MRRAIIAGSIPGLLLLLAAASSLPLRGAGTDDTASSAPGTPAGRVEELRAQLSTLREQEADLVKQLQRASDELPMVWEADGRKLEKVVHAIVLKPDLTEEAPAEWREALAATSKPVLVWKLQWVKGELVWTLERAKDAAVQVTEVAQDAPPEWKEAWRREPRQTFVWTLEAEAVKE
jgi:hypothetical protein